MEKALENLLAAPRPLISPTVVLAMIETRREHSPLEICLKDYDALPDGWEEVRQKSNSQPNEVAV